MPSADQVPVKTAHSTMRWHKWVVLIAGSRRDPRGRSVPLRMGINSGPVVAGVVGTRKFFYDVWGDAVNVAARMETTGSADKIQVSQNVYERLRDEFVLEVRGEIEVKGKGRMPTWFLLARKPHAVIQPLPTQADELKLPTGSSRTAV
jgi:adenylate cyclase